MVDGGRVVAREGELAGGFKRLTGGLRDSPHALLDHVEHFHRESSHRALQLTEIGHHVRGLAGRSEEHTSELQSQSNLVCRLLLEKKNTVYHLHHIIYTYI